MTDPHIKAIIKAIQDISKANDDLNRRMSSMMLSGRVHEVNGSSVRLALPTTGDEPFLSPWVQLQDAAGGTSSNFPVAVGDPMRLLSPNGEIGPHSLAIRDSHTDDKANPATNPEDLVLKHGESAITMASDGLRLTHGSSTLLINGEMIQALSSQLKHNAKNVGDSHKHSGVARGGSLTDEPA